MSLSVSYDDNNIFAKILRGEIPNSTVYEDDEVLCFMDLFPQAPGHCLIIPKKEKATNFLTATPETLAMLMERSQKIARAMVKALKPDGFRIIQFNGTVAGQTVFHLHFHILPIYENQPLKPHGSKPADLDELSHLAQKIAAAIE